MRVLHVMKSDPVLYGMQRVLLNELVEQRAHGVDACYLSLHETRMGSQADAMSEVARSRDVPVVKVPIAGRISYSAIRAVADAISGAGADIVHTHGYKGDVFGVLGARLARVPVVGEVHGWLFPTLRSDPLIAFYEWLDAQVLKRMDCAIAPSDHYRRLLLGMGFKAKRVKLVPNGVVADELRARAQGHDLRAQLGIPEGSPVVGVLARLSHEKGVDLFVRAMAFVRRVHPNVRAVITGGGPREAELKALTSELGLGEHVIWAGFVPSSVDAMRAFDVVALTSRIEALPQVLLEAMIMERPTVVTPVGGCPEIVVDGETGLVAGSLEPEMIAASISRLLSSPELAREMGKAGARRVEKEFSMGLWFDRTQALYEETVRA